METAKPMHRLSNVRRQQGVSLDEVARRMKTPIDRVIWQETETTDLWISDLWAWQEALGVPVLDLLIDRASPLEAPTVKRSQINRLMKIASHIRNRTSCYRVQKLANRMITQLFELMIDEE